MRVGVDPNKFHIQIPLPPKIDPSVTMMTVEEKPDVTYNDVVELPMPHPEKFVKLGIDPPKGVLCYGPLGTGKTLLARAVANRTNACFIRVIGSELVRKYIDGTLEKAVVKWMLEVHVVGVGGEMRCSVQCWKL
uniref:ATPase AAA-type core domain-containing protein n=1 Tax=Fagus sylvatica TaxID=28930 RepID=A0A2N9HVG0_FAGSY